MSSRKERVNENIARARYSLPFFSRKQQELIMLLPALCALDKEGLGIFGRVMYTAGERDLLLRLFPDRGPVVAGRLPDKVHIESLIILPRPSIHADAEMLLLAIPRNTTDAPAISAALERCAPLFVHHRMRLHPVVTSNPPQLLIAEFFRTGVVLAGRHPVRTRLEQDETGIFLGDLPALITDASEPPSPTWDPFREHLSQMLLGYCHNHGLAAISKTPDVSPFMLPYLQVMEDMENDRDTEGLEKIAACLYFLFAEFPPAKQVVTHLARSRHWPLPQQGRLQELSWRELVYLRQWLVPREENELPLFSWPGPQQVPLAEVNLSHERDLWRITGDASMFMHRYPWVCLVFGALAGLINRHTRVRVPDHLGYRRNAATVLGNMVEATIQGSECIIADDPLEGAVRASHGRWFYTPDPLALLGEGKKYSLELRETIKKKAILDDIGLEDLIKGAT